MSQFGYIIFGAVLATAGGVFAEWVKISLDNKNKKSALKARLSIVVDKSIKVIDSLVETYDQSDPHLIHNTYVDRLGNIYPLYDQIFSDLYLIDKEIRDQIMDYFDKLSSLVAESTELVSASGEGAEADEIQGEHDRKINAFRSLKTTGESILSDLE